jgi:hypothetical protein
MSFWNNRQQFEVPCTVEIEQTSDTLHAHVVLDGDVQIAPGDEVRVHDAPTGVAFGERLVVRRMATVRRGNAFDRLRAKVQGYLELTELYEVSFSDGRAS